MKRSTSRLLTAKALAIGVVAASGVGGVALAAGTGHLPNPAAGDHPNLGRSAEAPGHNKTEEPTEEPTEDPTTEPTEEPTTGPSLEGLCKAFQAGEANGHAKKLTNPAFSTLVEAAGDEGAVSTYCVDLVGEPKVKPEHPEKPTHPEHPAQPEKPETPAQPTKPEHPAKPEKPTQPEHPAKPEKPETPAN